MEWTQKDREALQAFETLIDSDDIRFKKKIKDILLNNVYIIHVLNNEELEESGADPDEYFGTNILPYYLISPTQSNTQNFICFESQFEEVIKYNKIIKRGEIRFYILCHQKDLIDKETGIARHDLLAALIMDEFNWTNYFGNQVHCVSDVASVVDTHYACRTLIFEGEFPNSISKNKLKMDGTGRTIDSDTKSVVINSEVVSG